MKRYFLESTDNTSDNVPSDLKDFVTELQLLYYVPLSYLIADETLLPTESIRFFHIDTNWTKALSDGALSIGRVTETDGAQDQLFLDHTITLARSALHLPRCNKMHHNHRKNALRVWKNKQTLNTDNLTVNDVKTDGVITGFMLRSELVRMLKGLEVSAYSGEAEIPLLRLDTLSDDIALGLFDGKMTSLVIAEPKTSLTFGLAEGEHMLVPKDVTEDNLGTPYKEKSIDINDYKNNAGRLNVFNLATELGKRLDTEMDSAKLAFELIAIANRAVFKEDNSGMAEQGAT